MLAFLKLVGSVDILMLSSPGSFQTSLSLGGFVLHYWFYLYSFSFWKLLTLHANNLQDKSFNIVFYFSVSKSMRAYVLMCMPHSLELKSWTLVNLMTRNWTPVFMAELLTSEPFLQPQEKYFKTQRTVWEPSLSVMRRNLCVIWIAPNCSSEETWDSEQMGVTMAQEHGFRSP